MLKVEGFAQIAQPKLRVKVHMLLLFDLEMVMYQIPPIQDLSCHPELRNTSCCFVDQIFIPK